MINSIDKLNSAASLVTSMTANQLDEQRELLENVDSENNGISVPAVSATTFQCC